MTKPTFQLYIGKDGAFVVHVDTIDMDENGQGPSPLRVYLNDDIIYANPDLEEK